MKWKLLTQPKIYTLKPSKLFPPTKSLRNNSIDKKKYKEGEFKSHWVLLHPNLKKLLQKQRKNRNQNPRKKKAMRKKTKKRKKNHKKKMKKMKIKMKKIKNKSLRKKSLRYKKNKKNIIKLNLKKIVIRAKKKMSS